MNSMPGPPRNDAPPDEDRAQDQEDYLRNIVNRYQLDLANANDLVGFSTVDCEQAKKTLEYLQDKKEHREGVRDDIAKGLAEAEKSLAEFLREKEQAQDARLEAEIERRTP